MNEMIKNEEEKQTKRDDTTNRTISNLTFVFCGLIRGPGLWQWTGNLHFRDLVDARSREYKGTKQRKEKKRLATEVFDDIKSRGGRFLKQEDTEEDDNADWYEVDDSVAMEKCKQVRVRETNALTL